MLAEQGRKEQGSEYRCEEEFLGLVMLNRGNGATGVASGTQCCCQHLCAKSFREKKSQ